MTPEYRAALLASRARMGALDRDIAREIVREIQAWAEAMSRWLADRPMDPRRTSVEASRELVHRTALEMTGRIRRAAATNRDLAFADVLDLWQKASVRVAQRRDVPDALLGAIRNPPLTMLAAQANRPGAATWQTLLQGHGRNAASEADSLIRRALLDGVSPPELAQRLRRYVTGSESFQGAFRRLETATGESWRIDLRQLPREARGQAQQMRSNAERIAVTEIHFARSDAEVLQFIADPLIHAIRWTLSPDRGANNPPHDPDICDLYATVDLFGLGPGVWPLHRVPIFGHPRCRCERNPVERAVSEAGSAKPMPGRVLAPADVTIPRAGDLTEKAHARILRQFEEMQAMSAASDGAVRAAMQSTARGRQLAGMVRP